jgi:predicted nucleic acid-binding protein
MRYCSDTWFLLKLASKDEKANEIMEEIIKGKSILFIPAVCIAEFTRHMIRKGYKKELIENIISTISEADSIFIGIVDERIAYEAGKLSASYNIPTIDAIISFICLENKCNFLLSPDIHFEILEKRKILKRLFW